MTEAQPEIVGDLRAEALDNLPSTGGKLIWDLKIPVAVVVLLGVQLASAVWEWSALTNHVDNLATSVAAEQTIAQNQSVQIAANASAINAVTIRLADDESQALSLTNRITDLTARIDNQATVVAAEGATLSGVADNVNRILTILQAQSNKGR
jgi:hypothetical protein